MIMYKKQIMRSVKIFLVDNDLLSLNIYREGLGNLGYKDISLYLNGTICLNNLNQKPNVIFLNHHLDDTAGFEVLKKIKRYSPNVYVVIVSSEENIRTANEALTHGAFDYITKGSDEIDKMHMVIERIYSIEK